MGTEVRKVKETLFVEIEFLSRSEGTIFREFEVSSPAILSSIRRDDFQTLDFLDEEGIDSCGVSNYEYFSKPFHERLAEIIYKSGISKDQSKSFLSTIYDLGEDIWKFNSHDRLEFCMKIWKMNLKAYNEGSNFALGYLSEKMNNALEPTETSKLLVTKKEELNLKELNTTRVILERNKGGKRY